MKYLLLFVLTLISALVQGQQTFNPSKIRPAILRLTRNFPIHNDTSLPTYRSMYTKTLKKATANELFELTNHPKPFVRLGSFYELLNRHSPKLVDLLRKNRADTTQFVQIQYGCLMEIHSLYDELLFYLSPRSGWDRHFKIQPAQKKFISSMLDKREEERNTFLSNYNIRY